jgi:hypothetical protein
MSTEPAKDPPSAPTKRGTLNEETGNTGGAILISEKLVQRMIQQGKLKDGNQKARQERRP